MLNIKIPLLLTVLALVTACSTAIKPTPTLSPSPKPNAPYSAYPSSKPHSVSSLPGWESTDTGAILSSFKQSCLSLKNQIGWVQPCQQIQQIDRQNSNAIKRFFEQHFMAWSTTAADQPWLVTGYYEPEIHGSLTQTERYNLPIYGLPDNYYLLDISKTERRKPVLHATKMAAAHRLKLSEQGAITLNPSLFPDDGSPQLKGRLENNQLLPYYPREKLSSGSVELPILAWTDNPIALFFMQIQGSGVLVLDNGKTLRLGHAGSNGYPYTSIGKWLVQQNKLAANQVSMQAIESWLLLHPQEQDHLLNRNQRYIFFKVYPENPDGPLGSLGVPLTAGHSIAVDPNYIPLGTPVYLSTTYPHSNIALNRLVCAQDTGSAIKGPARADFFWGRGKEAGEKAGKMKQSGFAWLLLPNEITATLAKAP